MSERKQLNIEWLIREKMKLQPSLERAAELLEKPFRRQVKSMRRVRDPKTGDATWKPTYYKQKGYSAIRDPMTGLVVRIVRDKSKDLD